MARIARSSSRNDAPHWRLDVVSNEKGLSHFYERERVKNVAHEYKIRFASWNIGSLTGRLAELVDTMVKRNVSILYVYETKCVGKKARIIEPWVYKLWYTGRDRNRNGVGMIINKQLFEDVMEVRRKGDKILLVKLIFGREIFNVISVYAP